MHVCKSGESDCPRPATHELQVTLMVAGLQPQFSLLERTVTGKRADPEGQPAL